MDTSKVKNKEVAFLEKSTKETKEFAPFADEVGGFKNLGDKCESLLEFNTK